MRRILNFVRGLTFNYSTNGDFSVEHIWYIKNEMPKLISMKETESVMIIDHTLKIYGL